MLAVTGARLLYRQLKAWLVGVLRDTMNSENHSSMYFI